jgi:hypothetical protein
MDREDIMQARCAIAVMALATALCATMPGAQAFDESKYPDLKGQWNRVGAPRWDPNNRTYQGVPLTPEYQAIFDANTANQRAGGQGSDPTYTCLSPGMPRIMNVYEPMEIVVTAETTHILIEHIHDSRRIHTDGREWPAEGAEPSFRGYTIGRWEDSDGKGHFDVLVAETRYLKGPRSFDSSGLPLHADNQTVIKERIYLDKGDRDLLHNEITVIDNALTRPWTVHKTYQRDRAPFPFWRESICAEHNQHLAIGKEDYFLSADGYLMPTRKDQPPPDLRYFKPAGQ